MSRGIRLFEHRPESILPLIISHLPASIFVFAALLSPSPPAPYGHTPKVWSTIPFPDDTSEVSPDAEGTIIVDLPLLSGGQVRVFDTLESLFPTSSSSNPEDTSPTGTSNGASISSEDPNGGSLRGARIEEGLARVVGALNAYLANVDGECKMVGGLHEVWVRAVEMGLGDGISKPGCGLWLPPPGSFGVDGQVDGANEGYEVDIGRDEDIEEFSHGSDIARDSAYYKSRLFRSTVIRPKPQTTNTSSDLPPSSPSIQPAVCHILTHADGSLGSLFTHPNHRRLGLAQWVVREHIGSGRGKVRPTEKGPVAFAVVFERNSASQRMFAGMGWRRIWGCSWVDISNSVEAEQGRERSRELDIVREGLKGSVLAGMNTLEGRC